MTVTELIEKLQEFAVDTPDLEVIFNEPAAENNEIRTVDRISLYEDDNLFIILNWEDNLKND